MFDQSKNQPRKRCIKCKLLYPDTGLYVIWQTKKGKSKIVKSSVCASCFNTEKEKMILE